MPALAGRKSPPQQTDCYPAFQRMTPPYWPGAGGPLMTGACEVKRDFIVTGPLWPAGASRWSSPNV